MPTLHIEHAISDFDVWQARFDQFADVREKAGVRSHTVRRPDDDPNYILIDLEFDTTERAEAFLAFLRNNVWSSPENAPALVGAPQAQVLD